MTFAEVQELMEMDGADKERAVALMQRWLDRGDGIAVYENMALDSLARGHLKFVSYGSAEAQLEVDTPPERLPDIGPQINWAYLLKGTCRTMPQLDAEELPT